MVFDLHENAERDLEGLAARSPPAAAAIIVALEEIAGDPHGIEHLTTHGEIRIGQQRLNIKPWRAARRHHNIFRLRILDTPATSYRIVYGYHWQVRRIIVLAIVHKEHLDYDQLDSKIAQRILADWNELTDGQAT